MTHPTCDLPDNVPDELVPDPQVAREFSVTLMTLWRWDRDPKLAELGWEPPVKIRTRNYRRRRPLEKFKAALTAVRGAPIDRGAAGARRRATSMSQLLITSGFFRGSQPFRCVESHCRDWNPAVPDLE
jgi:hypothetical protein